MNRKKRSLLVIGVVELVALMFVVIGNVLNSWLVIGGFLIAGVLSMILVFTFIYMACRGNREMVILANKVVSISCIEILLLITACFYSMTHGYIVNSVAFFWIFPAIIAIYFLFQDSTCRETVETLDCF